jgi:hypothetical protein
MLLPYKFPCGVAKWHCAAQRTSLTHKVYAASLTGRWEAFIHAPTTMLLTIVFM